MARTKQTDNPPPKPIPRVHKFTDHAGVEAIRARLARPGAFRDVATEDFKKNPVFSVQVYTLVDLHLDESSTKRTRIRTMQFHDNETDLHCLLQGLSALNSERPPPVFDIYTNPQPDTFACVAHQKREIAYRKARADRPDTLLIPKFARDWDGSRKTGYCIIITADLPSLWDGTCNIAWAEPGHISLVWARFPRGDTPAEMTFSRLLSYYPQRGDRATEFDMNLSESFSRRDIDCDMESDPDEVVLPLEQYCDLGLDDHEQVAVKPPESTDLAESLDDPAKSLASEDYSIHADGQYAFTISNNGPGAEPDLRYLIYVSLPLEKNSQASLERIAKAFTYNITSRLVRAKTFSFEFRKPSDTSYNSILADFHSRTKSEPEDYTGTLVNLEEDTEHHAHSSRLHCQSQSMAKRHNIFDEDDAGPIRYNTFVVILIDADIAAKGSVEYVLADGVAGEYVNRWRQMMFDETVVWRNEFGGIEDTARRLEMRFDE